VLYQLHSPANFNKGTLFESPEEPLKAFLLSVMAGFRKNEIDTPGHTVCLLLPLPAKSPRLLRR
jgi:hypothetical protein